MATFDRRIHVSRRERDREEGIRIDRRLNAAGRLIA
jgi:hypothetical protein